MLYMFDSSGNRVIDWRLGKKLSFPKDIEPVDINAISIDGSELEFVSGIISGLVYPKNFSAVWWYGAQAKTVAGILDTYGTLVADSARFMDRKQRLKDAGDKVKGVISSVKAPFLDQD